MNFLITRPHHDPATIYLSVWSQEVINVAHNKGYTVIDIKNDKVTKAELTSRIKKLNPRFLMLNGHGSKKAIGGHDNKIIIEAGGNEKLLHSRITYAVSCKAGKTLGPKCTNKITNTAFIGYDDDFVFINDKKHISRPLQDKKAKPFMEASNHVAISLLKGHTATESSQRSKDMFKKSSQKLLSSKSDPDSLQAAKYLWWNMMHQVCLGDGKAIV